MIDATKKADAIVRDGLGSILSREGFKKKGRTYWKHLPQAIQVVDVQLDKWNKEASGRFTLNLGLYFPAAAPFLLRSGVEGLDMPGEAQCLLRRRVGKLLPEGHDKWWEVSEQSDSAAIAAELSEAWTRFIHTWLEKNSEPETAMEELRVSGAIVEAASMGLMLGDPKRASALIREGLSRYPQKTDLLRWWAGSHSLSAE